MDIQNIQSLIKDRRIVTSAEVDPTQVYVQVGVWQPGTRKSGSADPDSYRPYVIALSELGGSSTVLTDGETVTGDGSVSSPLTGLRSVVSVKVNLDSTDPQTLVFPNGSYIIEKAYLTNATIDVSSSAAAGLLVNNSVGPIWRSEFTGPCIPGPCDDWLNYLYTPANFVQLLINNFNQTAINALGPCWPPPCNGQVIFNGGDELYVQMTTGSGIGGTVDLLIVVHQIKL
jgi:hypothetical protein